MDPLAKKFLEAGLVAKVESVPIVRVGNADIFQMDIRRGLDKVYRKEYFLLYRGHKDNRVEVINVDKGLKQLILMVHEPERSFVETLQGAALRSVVKSGKHDLGHIRSVVRKGMGSGQRLIACEKNGESFVIKVESKTPSAKRHYLLGVDERQLFIAELPRGISTVKQAHTELKGSRVSTAEGQAPGVTKRQGEWFFLNPTEGEQGRIDAALKNGRYTIQKNVPIANIGGKPHMVSERLEIPPVILDHGFSVQRRNDIFVRGKVKHADHKTVQFPSWRKVMLNNERRAVAPTLGGGTWRD